MVVVGCVVVTIFASVAKLAKSFKVEWTHVPLLVLVSAAVCWSVSLALAPVSALVSADTVLSLSSLTETAPPLSSLVETAPSLSSLAAAVCATSVVRG